MRVRALKTISTSKGNYPPGEIFEIDDGIAKRLLDVNAVEVFGDVQQRYTFAGELNKLKAEELHRLAEILDLDHKELKKKELIELLEQEVPNSELEELEGLTSNEIRAYLGE